ncbi:2-hydroxyacid dehydrogenase [Propionibacteriaceae bacterium Y1700]|uniref:2-hydroxyacid dehydrogenase n=1 Tax=Microlunatus sp. Y1700 TaxID=3418487 RepID=UPI003DA771D7
MLAWLPYDDLAAAEQALGPLPEGVEFEPFRTADTPPQRVDEVGFFVVPYLSGTSPLDRIGEMTSLEVVQTQTAGYEEILPLVPPGVTLCNAAGVHDASTAELALALILANGRHLDIYARQQSEGLWKGRWGNALADKRVLILGYGRIGSAIERRLSGFEVASVTKVASRARDDIHGVEELPQLLPEADIVIVIAPHTEQTDKIINAETLALMPDDALLVNMARGKLVDTDALVAETSSGRLRAALDVTEPEPLPADHPLWTSSGVTISPHVGGASSAFTPRTNALISQQLGRWARGEQLDNVVRAAQQGESA